MNNLLRYVFGFLMLTLFSYNSAYANEILSSSEYDNIVTESSIVDNLTVCKEEVDMIPSEKDIPDHMDLLDVSSTDFYKSSVFSFCNLIASNITIYIDGYASNLENVSQGINSPPPIQK
jgi:hypothetical protein